MAGGVESITDRRDLCFPNLALRTIDTLTVLALLLTPDEVRGGRPTLCEAVTAHGWPTVNAARGKVVFLLDNEGALCREYLQPSEILAGRLLFVSVPRTHPAAAWMKRNDPVGSFDEIQSLVKAGFVARRKGVKGYGTGKGYAKSIEACETCLKAANANPQACLHKIHK